jgi:hypothetical protein
MTCILKGIWRIVGLPQSHGFNASNFGTTYIKYNIYIERMNNNTSGTPVQDMIFKCGNMYTLLKKDSEGEIDTEYRNYSFVGVQSGNLSFLNNDDDYLQIFMEEYKDYEAIEQQKGGRRIKKTRKGKRSGCKTYRHRR